MANFSHICSEVYDRVSRSQYYRDNLAGLTAHQRHTKLLAELSRGDPTQQAPGDAATAAVAAAAVAAAAAALGNTVSDDDVLRQHHRFLRGPGDEEGEDPSSWGVRLARRYYARLFKEYAIADLSRYKESKIGMRWRTKQEVVAGKGQFVCGARGCSESSGLASYEVNFAYVEAGQSKQALVQLRLCEGCAHKLNYKQEKQYRKLGQSVLEQQEQQRQQGAGQQQEQQRQRKHKHKRSSRDREEEEEKEQQQQQAGSKRGDSRGSDRKRQRHSRDEAGEEQQQQQAQHGRSGAAAAAAAGGRGDEGLTDGDIDRWLDDMFSTAPA